jgi:hypothetical protein
MECKGGLVLGICVIVAAFVLAFTTRTAILPNEVGRYQFAGSNGVNVFVLDTKTGRIWQKFVNSTGGPSEWSENSVPWVQMSEK